MARDTEILEAIVIALDNIDGDRSPLDLVEEIPLIEAATERVVAARIAAARRQGLSWAAIAQRLGMTRQAAHKRFGKDPDRGFGARIELRLDRAKRTRQNDRSD